MKKKYTDLKIFLIVLASLLLAIILYVLYMLIYTHIMFVTPSEAECEHCHQVKTSRWYHVGDLSWRVCEDCYKAYERGEWGNDNETRQPTQTTSKKSG